MANTPAVEALNEALEVAGGSIKFQVRIVPPRTGNVVCVSILVPVAGGFTGEDHGKFDVVGYVTPGIIRDLLEVAGYLPAAVEQP